MPISIDEFESESIPGNEPSTAEQIVVFLATNNEKAFTRGEIADAIDADPNTVGTNLTRLKKRGLVRHRGNYWAITDDEQRLRDAYQLHELTEQLGTLDGGFDTEAWADAAPEEPHPSERDEAEGED